MKEKFQHHPHIKRIARHRHLPKSIYGQIQEQRIMREARRRKYVLGHLTLSQYSFLTSLSQLTKNKQTKNLLFKGIVYVLLSPLEVFLKTSLGFFLFPDKRGEQWSFKIVKISIENIFKGQTVKMTYQNRKMLLFILKKLLWIDNVWKMISNVAGIKKVLCAFQIKECKELVHVS